MFFVVAGCTLARGVRGVGDGVIDLIAVVSDDAFLATFASLPPPEPWMMEPVDDNDNVEEDTSESIDVDAETGFLGSFLSRLRIIS